MSSNNVKAVAWAAALFLAILAIGVYLAEPWARPLVEVLFAPARAVQRVSFEFPGTLGQASWHLVAALAQFAACFGAVLAVRALNRKAKCNDI
jgi:hypothetical protein